MDLYIQRRRLGVSILLLCGLELILAVAWPATRTAVGEAGHETHLALLKIVMAMIGGVFVVFGVVYVLMRWKESARKKPPTVAPEPPPRRAPPYTSGPSAATNSSLYGRRQDSENSTPEPVSHRRAAQQEQGVPVSAAANSSFYGRSEVSPNRAPEAAKPGPSSYRQTALQNQEVAVAAPLSVSRPSLSAWGPVVCLLLLVVGLGVGFRVYQSNHTSLFNLIAAGQVEDVSQRLSENTRELNQQNKDGMTPLMAAIEAENEAMVEILLAHRADVNRVDEKGCSPLILATGNSAMMEMLLRQGADVSYADAERMSALHWAIRKQSPSAVRILLHYDAPVNVRNLNFDTPLLMAVKNDFKEINLLLMHGADPHVVDQIGETPLHHAAEKDALAHAEALLAAGAEPVVFSRQGWTPLHTACRNGALSVAALLLKAHVPVDIENNREQTPLGCAVQNDDAVVVAYLLRRGADLMHVDRNGNTVLHLALANHNFEAARVLIESGADLDVTNDAGLTPRELIESSAPSLLTALKTTVSAP
jgi:ankyrin repeat protein